MKKQILYGVVSVFLFSVSGFLNAEKTVEKTPAEKTWRKKDADPGGDAAVTMIWTKYSKELAEIRKLRRKDPEAFKSRRKEFFEKVRREIREEREKFRNLVAEYRKTKNPETREKIKKYVSEAYERRLKESAEKIAEKKKKLKDAEEKLEKAKSQKEEIINRKLKTLLMDPGLNW
ncbi:MAG: hypothetical protein WC082_11595 [Victivallales bacterium]|jgi:hypothetical protein